MTPSLQASQTSERQWVPWPTGFVSQISKRIDPYVLILCFLPVIILARDSNPIFTPPSTVDPWVYYGFFRNLLSFKRDLFPGTYYGSRLSWILPGYTVNQLFSPLAANYVLHLTVFYVALLSFFFILKSATDRRTALLGGTLFGCYPYLWSAVGWDYVDGAGIAYCLLTFALLTRASATTPPRHGTLVGAGAAYALLIYSNLAWFIFSPTFLAYYTFRCWSHRSSTGMVIFRDVLVWCGIGAAAVTATFCLINHILDGNYLFYAPSVLFASGSLGKPNPYKHPVQTWIMNADWLILPALTIVVSLTRIVLRRLQISRDNITEIMLVAQFFFISGLLVWLESKDFALLQVFFYASYLIPFAFLVLGCQFREVSHLSRRRFSLVVVLTLIILAVSWLDLATGRLWHWEYGISPRWPFWLALLAIVVGAIFVNRTAALVTVLIGIALLYSYLMHGRGIFWNNGILNSSRGSFERIVRSMKSIDEIREERPVRFWYNVDGPYGKEVYSLNAAYLWGYTGIGMHFPALGANINLAPGTLVVVPSNDRNALKDAVKSFQMSHYTLKPISLVQIEAEGGRYWLFFFTVITDPKQVLPLMVSFDGSDVGKLLVQSDHTSVPLPMKNWTQITEPGSKMERLDSGIRVLTAKGPWTYATVYSSLSVPADGTYRFLLKYKPLSGHTFFGVMDATKSNWICHSQEIRDGTDRLAECNVAARAGDKIWLLTTNAEPVTRSPSSYVIEELRAFRYVDR